MPELDPATTALLTVECQNGVVGEESALPELAKEARDSGMLGRVAALVDAAHAAGVQVLHAIAERRPDGLAANANARLFRAAGKLPVRQLSGSRAVEVAAPIEVAENDLVVRRLHGLSPISGTDVDALLRNLGIRTLVVAGSPRTSRSRTPSSTPSTSATGWWCRPTPSRGCPPRTPPR